MERKPATEIYIFTITDQAISLYWLVESYGD